MKIEEKHEGDVSGNFIDYTTDMNRYLIKAVFDRYKIVGFMTDMPSFIIEILATYPESLKCNK